MSQPNPNNSLHRTAPKKKIYAATGGASGAQAKASAAFYMALAKGILPGKFPASSISY